MDYDIYDVRALDTSDVLNAMRATIEGLRAANVVLYAIDPRGLVTPEDGLVERNTYARDSAMDGAIMSATRMAAVRRSLQSLRQLAEETGGFAAVDRNTFDGAFDRIAAQTSSLYLLGVEAGEISARRDGNRIDVSVRRGGARVSARRRFVRPATPAEPRETADERHVAMRTLLASPTSTGALRISAQIIPVGTRDNDAATETAVVLVEVDGQGFRNVAGDDRSTLAIDLAVLPMDDGGEAAAQVTSVTATIRLNEDMLGRLGRHGFRWLHELPLPAVTREMRVAVQVDGGGSGMVVAPVEPRLAGTPAISAVVVASTSAAGAVTTGDRSTLPFARAIPTTRRVFKADDLLEFAVGISPDETALVGDDVIVRLTSASGRARQVTLDPVGAATPGAFYTGMLPLAGYPAGDHAMEVSARFAAGSQRHELPLCVR